jgi:hypothetical protein
MARVIRLPDGRVFRSEPLVKDPTKLGMGNKGAFDFSETVKLLDQVAESKGIGALANVAEKAYDAIRGDVKRPGEKEKEGQIKKEGPADALTQAAMARVSQAGTKPPPSPESTPEMKRSTPMASGGMLLRSDEAPQLVRAEPTPAQKAVAELDAAGQAMGEQAEREARIRENNRMIQEAAARRLAAQGGSIDVQRKYTPIPSRASAQPAMPAEELPAQQINVGQEPLTQTLPGGRPERRLVRNTRAGIEAGGPPIVYEDQLARSPEGVVEQPEVPPLQVPGPAEVAPPQPPPPQMAVPVPTQEPPGMTGGGAPQRQKTLEAEAKAAAKQVAANIGQEALRTEPVKAAEIDMAQFRSPTGKAKGSIQFFEEMAGALQQKGIGRQTTTPPMEIPYTVSIDELYGYARQADTYENQRRVLDALANNRVTGMGFSTLADRLSGAYRQRYLTNVVSMFPKVAGQPNLIDAIGTIGKAYAAEQLGAARAADIAAGKAEAGVTKTLAQAGQAAAGAQLAAERAVTEREIRPAKVQNLLSQGTSRLIEAALKKAKGRGTGKAKRKINLPVFKDATIGGLRREQATIDSEITSLTNKVAQLEGLAANADLDPPTASQRALDPAGARKLDEEIRKARQAAAQLTTLRTRLEERQSLREGIAERMGYLETLIATMAAGVIPTDDEFAAAGISKAQAMQLKGEQSVMGVKKSRSRPTTRPPGYKAPTAADVFP